MKTSRIIHQIWLGDEEAPTKVMRSWPMHHPGFQYILWTDKKVEKLHLHNRKIYKWLKSPTMKADLLRYEILYQYGGIYADADLLCLKPLDFLLEHECFAAQDNYWWGPKKYLANGLIGCSPRHLLMAHLVQRFADIPLKSKTGHGALTTGPKYFTQVWKETGIKVEVLPRELYMQEIDQAPPEAVTIHVNQSHISNIEYYRGL